jgi:uncharacterized membrane protein
MTNLNSKTKVHFFFLLLIMILGFTLRYFHIDHNTIWLDEKISLSESNGLTYTTSELQNSFTTDYIKKQNNLKNVIDATIKEDGGNGILYILKLHYWQKLFGSSDRAIRILSLIFNLLLIPVGYYFSLIVFKSKRVAIIAAIIFALHPMLIHYAQEARPYSMAIFFSCLSSLFFYKAFFNQSNSKYVGLNLLAFGFFSLMSVLTHYLTAYIFLAQGVFFLIYNRRQKDYIRYISCWLCIIVVIVFWLLNGGLEGLHYMSLHNQQYTELLKSHKDGEDKFLLPANFKYVFLGWIQQLLSITGNTLQQSGFRLRELTILLIIPGIIVIAGIKRKSQTEKSNLVLLLMILLSSTVYATTLAIVTGHTISFQPGYGIFAVPYFILLISFGIDSLFLSDTSKLKNMALIGIFTFLMVISLFYRYSTDIRNYSDAEPSPLAALTKKIEKECLPTDTLVFPFYTEAIIVNIYLKPNNGIIQMIDSTTNSKVLIKNSNKVLFGFENGKYRE